MNKFIEVTVLKAQCPNGEIVLEHKELLNIRYIVNVTELEDKGALVSIDTYSTTCAEYDLLVKETYEEIKKLIQGKK